MTVALAIVCVVQALALGAVALRAVWPVTDDSDCHLEVGGGVVPQEPEDSEDAGSRVGFRRCGNSVNRN
jgi:hypothetical protein